MTHPILALQSALAAALAQDGVLSALVGEAGIFDAPPKGRRPPYVTFARHDVVPRDGDLAPGHEHRIVVHAWAGEASRKAVLAICDAVLATALGADLGAGLAVTNRVHERTDTEIDRDTGLARAAITLRFFTEAAP